MIPVLGAALLALTLAGLALHQPGADNVGSIALTNWFVLLMALAGGCYLAAVALVLRRRAVKRGAGRGRLVWVVLAVAVAMRLAVLAAPPFLSSDLFRYVWDGRVQLAGINPYRYIPADPALAALRDDTIYPHINRRDYAPTIYPPMAQLVFRFVASISQTPLAIRAAMLGFELLAMLCVLRLLALARQPPERILIYAWNPLAIWTFAGNGHVDAIAIGLVALALLAAATRRAGWAGAVLGAAIAVKFLPAAIAPALWRRWDWKFPAACAAILVVLYGCYAGIGWKVFGFLGDYGAEEGLRDGSGFWLLAGLAHLVDLPDWASAAYLALAALVLLAMAARIAFRPASADDDPVALCRRVGVLIVATTLVISPHYPWYFVWLAVPGCVAPGRCIIWLSLAPLLLYLDPLHERFVWPALIYVPAIFLAMRDLHRADPVRELSEPVAATRMFR